MPDLVHAVRRVRAGDFESIRGLREGVMSGESLLVILLVGLVAGWLAGHIVRGTGFGLVGDLLIGIVGAFIGGWLPCRIRYR
jgi:F0F1-type ATP synthase assembly protein I